ncbi:hypothetical protein H9P43_003877 [Blastocladiella emersonii ATCC 22665]|nr:hypothetical protein H9P43_003877 [Blastocladiella emersonii ATCC 22665]
MNDGHRTYRTTRVVTDSVLDAVAGLHREYPAYRFTLGKRGALVIMSVDTGERPRSCVHPTCSVNLDHFVEHLKRDLPRFGLKLALPFLRRRPRPRRK